MTPHQHVPLSYVMSTCSAAMRSYPVTKETLTMKQAYLHALRNNKHICNNDTKQCHKNYWQHFAVVISSASFEKQYSHTQF